MTTEAMVVSGVANYSLCHGVTGNAEVLRYGAEVLGGEWQPAWTALNGRVAQAG